MIAQSVGTSLRNRRVAGSSPGQSVDVADSGVNEVDLFSLLILMLCNFSQVLPPVDPH